MTNPSEPSVELVELTEEQVILPQASVTLEQHPENPGGFTIGYTLASHTQQQDDASEFRIPVVDIVALAVVNVLKTVPDDLKREIDRVNSAIADLGAALGQPGLTEEQAIAAIAAFNESVGAQVYG